MEKESNKWVALSRGEYFITINNEIYKVFVGDGKSVTVNDVIHTIDLRKIKDDEYALNVFDSRYEISISDFHENKSLAAAMILSSKLIVTVNGLPMQAIIDDQRSLVAQSWLLRKPHISKSTTLCAPMPGLITKVLVHDGMTVQMGSVLLILEAMKMENEIRALQRYKIESVFVQPGATVERNDELIKITEI